MFDEDPSRIPIHARDIIFRSFLRPDGLWDIEGSLHDSKAYDQPVTDRGPMPAGMPIHHMRIRLTIDEGFTVRAVQAQMPATPFDECQPAAAPLQALVGVTIGGGWRRAIGERLGGVSGCTHLRELLFGMGTAAFQTVGRYRAHQLRKAGLPEPVPLKPRPPLGQCLGWDFNGGPVKRRFPQFAGWKEPSANAASTPPDDDD
jgi:hypothetical protein